MNEAQKLLQSEYLQGIGRGDALPDGCDTASFSKSGWISAKGEGWELTEAGRDHLGTLSSGETLPTDDDTASVGEASVAAVGDASPASGAVQLL